MVVLGSYTANPVTPNYAVWSAVAPLGAATSLGCAADASPGQGSALVPLQLVVPGQDGLPVLRVVDTGCVTFTLPPEAGAASVDAGGQ